MTDPILWSMKEAENITGFKARSITRYIDSGEIKGHKEKGDWKIVPTDLRKKGHSTAQHSTAQHSTAIFEAILKMSSQTFSLSKI